jgi:hypothetical protein
MVDHPLLCAYLGGNTGPKVLAGQIAAAPAWS